MTQLTNKPSDLILVLGRLCSGKGFYCKQLQDRGYYHHTTSDTVKKLSGFDTRDKLTTTKSLDQAIADELLSIISRHDKVVIDGIRQTSILDRIVHEHPTANIIWLDASSDTRKARYLARGSSKDSNTSFEQSEQRDDQLGLADVEHIYKPHSIIIDHN